MALIVPPLNLYLGDNLPRLLELGIESQGLAEKVQGGVEIALFALYPPEDVVAVHILRIEGDRPLNRRFSAVELVRYDELALGQLLVVEEFLPGVDLHQIAVGQVGQNQRGRQHSGPKERRARPPPLAQVTDAEVEGVRSEQEHDRIRIIRYRAQTKNSPMPRDRVRRKRWR